MADEDVAKLGSTISSGVLGIITAVSNYVFSMLGIVNQSQDMAKAAFNAIFIPLVIINVFSWLLVNLKAYWVKKYNADELDDCRCQCCNHYMNSSLCPHAYQSEKIANPSSKNESE